MAGQKVVSFHYTLRDSKGSVLESSEGGDPMSYLEGVGQIIPGLENQLHGMQKGEKATVNVLSKDAYGEIEPGLVMLVPRDKIPAAEINIGDQFNARDPNGQPTIVTVTAVDASNITVDANHPLAGQDLSFEVEITEVREATAEELSHGHAHGEGGHHHH